jgi:Glycosyltransferase family 87
MTEVAATARTTVRRPLLHDALTIAAVAAIAWAWYLLQQGEFLLDARAYWSVDLSDPYAESLVGRAGTYLYSPAFAIAIWPLTLLPWAVFAALWSALNLVVLVRLAGPILAAALLFLPFLPVRDEISTGNIHLLIAAAVVLSFRWPSAWAFPLLTKVTPGVGVLWFAGAREWRNLAIAIGTTLVIVAVTFAVMPQAWIDWLSLLTRSAGVAVPSEIGVIPGPLWLRTAVAGVLVVLGGWRGWRWTVPVAVTLALPVTWSSGLTVLIAILPIYEVPARLSELLRGRP